MKMILAAGARPNFMKISPLIRAINKYNLEHQTTKIEPLLVHTGQHYDYNMSKIFFKDLELHEPDIYLGVGSGTHAVQTGKIMIEFEKVLFQEKPDLVVVVGDVNSTLAAALAAVKLHIPIAHVEAGLRLYDLTMPEEVNRLLTDGISGYLFTPSRDANQNLRKEGIPHERIFFVGNIMVDSLLLNKERAAQRQILSQLGLEKENYAVLTLHRPDNVNEKETLLRLISAMSEISKQIPIVFPAHPRTQKQIEIFGFEQYFANSLTTGYRKLRRDLGVYCIDPLGYLDFLNLEMNAKFVMTDSGGMQAETTILNIPCLTLYRATSWIVTMCEGTNALVGTDPAQIIEEAFKILDGGGKKGNRPELWDGKVAERIIKVLAK